jgi:hypothetical protein
MPYSLGFNFPLEYSIRNAEEDQEILKLNGTHQLLVYADKLHLMDEHISAIKEHR